MAKQKMPMKLSNKRLNKIMSKVFQDAIFWAAVPSDKIHFRKADAEKDLSKLKKKDKNAILVPIKLKVNFKN